MSKPNKYVRKIKTLPASAKKALKKFNWSKYAKDKRVWAATAVVVVALVFWVLPAYRAKAPGQLGYGMKRFEESVAATLAPTAGLRDGLRLRFAGRRVSEAAYVAAHTVSGGKVSAAPLIKPIAPEDAQAADTINHLLSQFTSIYQGYSAQLAGTVDQNKKLNPDRIKQLQKQAVEAYASLALLRVQAPTAAQISVLSGIDAAQKHIATVNDALEISPLSSSDVSQLTKLVSVGILSKTDLDKLLSTQMDNRQFHAKLVGLVDSKQLPSNLLYSLDEDLVKQLTPDKAAAFEAVSDFEQMQRISATVQASRPTKDQQQAVQAYLAKYKLGDVVPGDDIQSFVTPIVYGMALAGELQANISSLATTPFSSDDQAVLDSWKGSLAANQQNLGQLYQQLMTGAANQRALHERLLARVQTEFVDAQKAGVDHLVLPPGWGADQMSGLSRQMGVELAADHFVAANPGTDQQLAVLTGTQKQLQASLATADKTNTNLVSKLETTVNTFTGTPEEVSRLKELLASITRSQTGTITDLQTQLAGAADLHTDLALTIQTLHSQQLISLTELELRASANAKDLTAAVKAELNTALGQINQTTQTLVSGLQTRVDGLDAADLTLQEQLDSSLEAVRNNHVELAAYVTAQLATGRATTDQLQTTLQSVQASLAEQTAELAGLGTDTGALTQLVNQVQASTASQADSLQGQIDSLQIDQQTVKDSIASLRDTQAAELQQLSDQLAHLSVLQAEAQVTLAAIGQQQTETQSSLSGLTNNFSLVQTTLETIQDSQTALQATVADQQSQLESLQAQTQSAITELTDSQAQLSAQIANLAANTTDLTQTLGTIQTASAATQTQLDTLLASPPWSIIPEGTYVTQAAFDSLQTSLNSQFVAKAVALDAQFQAFEQQIDAELQQVNATVSQLGQTTATQNTNQQQTIDTLNAQVQALQAQVQALAPTTGL